MPRITALSVVLRKNRLASFTLIELLTVMAIIAILAGLILAAGSGVMLKAKRSRASGEIQAMSTALDSYKTDNGTYPAAIGLVGGTTASYPLDPSISGGPYQVASQILFQALTGKTNFNDTPIAGTKDYFPSLKANQVGNSTTAAGTGYSAATGSYMKDPWNYSYGYSTGDGTAANVPANGPGFFDLWSTAGLLANPSATAYATNTWITNWK